MTLPINEDDFDALFAPEPMEATDTIDAEPWKVLLVDDEQDIHALFRLALHDVCVEGRPLQLLTANSAQAAREQLQQHPEIALLLLDVVMENDRAGLDLAWEIRQTFKNALIQIVLITGQPGYAPQRQVIIDYEINGYRLKSELSADKIFVSVYSAIRIHHTMLMIMQQQELLTMLMMSNAAKTQVAEAANQAKSNFLAAMSHEIRTPLHAILGMAELLCLPNCSPENQRECARTISSSGQALLSLLNDILDLCDIEDQRLELVYEASDPEHIIRSVSLLFSEHARQKNLQLTSAWNGEQRKLYLLDAKRLRQMLTHLIGNAIKFTEHGFVHIEARECRTMGKLAELEFCVTDSGIGITTAQQSQLFQPFTQLAGGLKRPYEGTGLGLSLVKRLSELMQGQIGVLSQSGQGSQFWFTVRCQIATMLKDDDALAYEVLPENQQINDTPSAEEPFTRQERLCLRGLVGLEAALDALDHSLEKNLFKAVSQANALQTRFADCLAQSRLSVLIELVNGMQFERARSHLDQIRKALQDDTH